MMSLAGPPDAKPPGPFGPVVKGPPPQPKGETWTFVRYVNGMRIDVNDLGQFRAIPVMQP